MLFSQQQELIETVRKLDAAEILAFRPLIHEAEVLHRAAEALMEALTHNDADLNAAAPCFTSLAYLWDFSFDFPGISIWSLLHHRCASSDASRFDAATAMVLSAIPVESCGVDFNDRRALMHAVEANFGPKTVGALIRLGATFSVDDAPKIMHAIATCQHVETMRELILLAAKTRLVAPLQSKGIATSQRRGQHRPSPVLPRLSRNGFAGTAQAAARVWRLPAAARRKRQQRAAVRPDSYGNAADSL